MKAQEDDVKNGMNSGQDPSQVNIAGEKVVLAGAYAFRRSISPLQINMIRSTQCVLTPVMHGSHWKIGITSAL